jgi:HEAT repeats
MTGLLALASALALWSFAAQPPAAPSFTNGRVVERAASKGLSAALDEIARDTSDVAWAGYSVPATDGGHHTCENAAGFECCGALRLEPRGASEDRQRPASRATVRLEPSRDVAVLVRFERGQPSRVRTLSPSCVADAGGRTIHWLTSVSPAESVNWLGRQASTASTRRLADDATAAIALHGDPSALDWLLASARTAPVSRQRGQALFWLSQRAGQKAVGAISEAIDRDPDTDVKKRAVFALSQLPDDEGVPRLIEVARSHSNKAVQKQAFFWLGQSKDPRALAFFREVLTR